MFKFTSIFLVYLTLSPFQIIEERVIIEGVDAYLVDAHSREHIFQGEPDRGTTVAYSIGICNKGQEHSDIKDE